MSVCRKDNTVFITPTPEGMVYENSIVELRDVIGKGEGVFAKRDLTADDMLVYYGRQHPSVTDYEEGNYVTELHVDKSAPKRVKLFVDGNPSLESKYAINLMFASKVNEPSTSERVNCRFEDSENGLDQKSLPPLFATFAYIQPTRLVKAGSELLICYGGSYPREYTTSCQGRDQAASLSQHVGPTLLTEKDAYSASAFIERICGAIIKPPIVSREAMTLRDLMIHLAKVLSQYNSKRRTNPSAPQICLELDQLIAACRKKGEAHHEKDKEKAALLDAEAEQSWTKLAESTNSVVIEKVNEARQVFENLRKIAAAPAPSASGVTASFGAPSGAEAASRGAPSSGAAAASRGAPSSGAKAAPRVGASSDGQSSSSHTEALKRATEAVQHLMATTDIPSKDYMDAIIEDMVKTGSTESVFKLKAFMEVFENNMKDMLEGLKLEAVTARAEQESAKERACEAMQRERRRHEWLHQEYVKRASKARAGLKIPEH